MSLTRDHLRRIVEVAHARNLGFVELVGLAELDPARAFRGVTVRNVDMSGQDLAGFDFTGATFVGCDLRGADLRRARGVTREILTNSRTDDATRRPRTLFWADGCVPDWADEWGHDKYGPWVSFRVPDTSISQRMRWIPPGTFRMGSPEYEEGRFREWEDFSEIIIFLQGFWMFETLCTQTLWLAVMGGKNLSYFQGADHPVDRVSFQDAQHFVQNLNRLKPGLALSLPSEAQWEYACRARTIEATYAGPALIKGKANTAVLDRIAWYDHNSGKKTHPVGLKEPNPWGLHDMLGNVWEWCADEWHDTHAGASPIGIARDGGSAWRVVRGGAWDYDARVVRAACRFEDVPGLRGILVPCVSHIDGYNLFSFTRAFAVVNCQSAFA